MTTIDKIVGVGSLIVGVAMIATIVGSKNSATIITAFGNSFSGSLRAAMGH